MLFPILRGTSTLLKKTFRAWLTNRFRFVH